MVYVLCYDSASEEAARREFAEYEWATVTRVPEEPGLSKYMEGAAYLKTLHDNRAEWLDADKVGVLSYRASSKIDVGLVRTACVETQEMDVLALLPSTNPLLVDTMLFQPRFLEVWVPLLLHMGFSASDAVHTGIPAFFCNYWLATPAWMDKFLGFFSSATEALDTLPDIQEALWSDSNYNSATVSAERCEQVYGRPYFPYHPFVCERLACFFFWKEHASIALAPLGKRQFWQEYFNAQVSNICARARLMSEKMPMR